MGTGSVESLVLKRLRGRPTVPVPIFGRAMEVRREKGGQAPRGSRYPDNSPPQVLGASPPFSLPFTV